MKVVPVLVRSDNYAYLLIDDKVNKALAVDAFDVPKVVEAAKKEGVELVGKLTTHHHFDHSGGNEEFARLHPGVPIYGGSNKAPALTHIVKDKDEFAFEGITIRALHTPCHTQDSICFHVAPTDGSHPGGVFTGDTLFIGGCGRFFEGTASEMTAALKYLATLPDATVVYNGHEYTAGNLAFAKSVEPDNAALGRLETLVQEHPVTTGLTTIADEKAWNPFLRLDSATIRKNTKTESGSEDEVMHALREGKNNFRG
ncbi:hypothetical protein PHLGIDRAFT_86892 [Phlebiopsis gigantea 11061_1 CR5-6]|uniref:hydroxyacylglutathione hydrolase n=1 Tax=Phlebiopsis gigantea (strain 11061_1 CR5-6) TaxID=745531 RepID=A0A0C3NV68_PHLG1|nr:hypothetical protein PHLGIDRAFT_86892 [Phlebiopsis gigantea 11061_1 CR5-6]